MLGNKTIKIESKEYTDFSIIKYCDSDKYEYIKEKSAIKIYINNSYIKTINEKAFQNSSEMLLKCILSEKGSSFSVCEEIIEFLKMIELSTFKASSRLKEDIIIKINENEMGFSIKSFLGRPPCLLSATKNTNILYRIESEDGTVDREFLNEINLLRTKGGGVPIKTIINKIADRYKIIPVKFCCDTLHDSLNSISNKIEKLLMDVVLAFYTSKDRTSVKNVKSIIEKFPNGDENLIEMSKFAIECDKSLQPTVVWQRNDFIKGTIYVDKKGNLLLKEYNAESHKKLLEKIKIDRGSSNRYKYGQVFFEDDVPYIKLNLQLRYNSLPSFDYI